jgi:urease accessory protein
MTIDVGRGARALIASQASTKIYRSKAGARQHVHGCIGEDALLAILPDPVVCFSGSSFFQEQRYDLSRRASLVLVDWMTSGRHASGERWAFNRYESRVEVRRHGRRCVYDGVRLSADEGALADRMERFNVCLMAILAGPLVSAAARSTVEAIASLPVEKDPDLVVSAARLRHDDHGNEDGAVLRIAGLCVEQVGAVLRDHLRPLTPLLGDDPWIRKW